MLHKERRILNLLGQFSQKLQQSQSKTDDKEKMMFQELGELISTSDLKRSNPNTTFGIPNIIWYLIMIGMVGYLIKEVFLLNNMKDVPSVVSTITKEVNEIKNTTNKALENAKKEHK